ncbi:MAG: hypothetical protein ACRC3Y_01545 [Romboutsia sp.]|uniref:hypothetical protein n=1 Tax=Romboutsia sp. TaxID=1965302 RepID=UPI003F2B7534
MKLKISLLALVVGLTLVGCSNEENNKQEAENNNEIQNEIDSSTDKPKEESDDKDEIEKNDIENIENDKVEESSKIEDESQGKEENQSEEEKEEISNEDIEFKIYTADFEDTNKIIEFKTINLKKDSSIEYKLNELINIMKKDYFKDDVSIVLESIDANNIATINLIDQEKWSKHFQGSTGGAISQATIIETILQREYQGEWIKGVKILVDGKNEEVFDHAPFEEIYYK